MIINPHELTIGDTFYRLKKVYHPYKEITKQIDGETWYRKIQDSNVSYEIIKYQLIAKTNITFEGDWSGFEKEYLKEEKDSDNRVLAIEVDQYNQPVESLHECDIMHYWCLNEINDVIKMGQGFWASRNEAENALEEKRSK